MEYVPGGDLGKFILDHGPIAEPYVKTIAKQLVDALGYLHDNKITHRDVKPDNILIHSTTPLVVKLTDFGLSKMIDTEQTFLKTFCGTLLYCAPEVYTEYSSYNDNGQRTNRRSHRPVDRERYGHAVDIWSLGGVLFYTLTGSPPFPVKNGTTYSELLDHIVKTPMNTSPLVKFNISASGVHFLSRMIHVRPETRATIVELESHEWLNPAYSLGEQEEFDENLHQSASQLSLNDREPPEPMSAESSSPREPEPDFSMDFESQKENYTIGQPHAPKLFGEVSAIGSSGVIPEDRLNLPVSDTSFGETERYGSEVRDSLEESDDFSTPRENLRQDQDNLSAVLDPSQPDNSRSALLGIGSQSLGGASSILKNLNMKSTTSVDFNLASSRISNLATSKRKPDDNTSDDYDMSDAYATPSLKRLKSEGNVNNLGDEDVLLAAMPQVIKSNTDRQINYPCAKRTYWTGRDDTWHLNYPEMTWQQHRAFDDAAKQRKEEFEPGKTPLWNLAMKYFPPTHKKTTYGARTLQHGKSNHVETPIKKSSGEGLLPATLSDTLDNEFNSQLDISAPNEYSSGQLSAPGAIHHARQAAGVFKSTPGSLVSNISISLEDPILSWGRETNNTVTYQPSTETLVPKHAFRILLWRDPYPGSVEEFRPWESGVSRTMRVSPEPDSYAFYIATKATFGLRINGNPLQSHDPKDATGICKYWMKLYNGDHIVFWGGEGPRGHAGLVFECTWSSSSITRPADEPPTCVPAPLASKLDRFWPVALRSLRRSQAKEAAAMDTEKRMQNMIREVERSQAFEQRRLEAVRRIAQQGTHKASAISNPLERAQSGPPVHRFAHPGRVQGGQ